ncbi:unnamed protein product [Clonostachys solani]|uniref:Fe2OG dioxygenase domain-containing protein n=1 Tax=Clonostachys solani TaxID=160281 RepID=A0A9P0ELJ1_9HYPO|nr:unnamed protein product [Clonostachys solani]
MAPSAIMTKSASAPSEFKSLLLRTYDGFTTRNVSTAPARDCTTDEVPIIDLSGMFGDLNARKKVASKVLNAAKTNGFFYIKNHGIPQEATLAAHQKAKEFFKLPVSEKGKLTSDVSSYGYHGLYTRQVNPSQSKDRKENFSFHYDPGFDPAHKSHLATVPQHVKDHLPKDSMIWAPNGIPEFKETILGHYEQCLATARRLIRIIALGLDLPEDYFDRLTSYPGADFALVFYPGHGEDKIEDPEEVGLGAHTDLQILTLLWQDENKGLQVLNNNHEWVFAPSIPGTLVVNIGDFLMRLTNNQLKSTVHRVIQHGKTDRYSMPFFFGFNFDEKLGVLPTCVDENNPPKYEPATCGELIAKRLALGAKPSS